LKHIVPPRRRARAIARPVRPEAVRPEAARPEDDSRSVAPALTAIAIWLGILVVAQCAVKLHDLPPVDVDATSASVAYLGM
jgi:hypothetical protein